MLTVRVVVTSGCQSSLYFSMSLARFHYLQNIPLVRVSRYVVQVTGLSTRIFFFFKKSLVFHAGSWYTQWLKTYNECLNIYDVTLLTSQQIKRWFALMIFSWLLLSCGYKQSIWSTFIFFTEFQWFHENQSPSFFTCFWKFSSVVFEEICVKFLPSPLPLTWMTDLK